MCASHNGDVDVEMAQMDGHRAVHAEDLRGKTTVIRRDRMHSIPSVTNHVTTAGIPDIGRGRIAMPGAKHVVCVQHVTISDRDADSKLFMML